MLKLDCKLCCEVCDNEITGWIELENFGGGSEPGLGDLFGAMFAGSAAPANYSIKGKPDEIGTWKQVTRALNFTCGQECYDKFEADVKLKHEELDAAQKWVKEVKGQKEVNISGTEVPDWFWEAMSERCTDEAPLCDHAPTPVHHPAQYRLRGGTKMDTQGFFTTKKEGFWIWHEPSNTSRNVELSHYAGEYKRLITLTGKVVKGQPAAK
jgi:hypothetical protein